MNSLLGASQRFSTRLIAGAFFLILLSAFGAGIPAYWLIRSELERQAWSTVRNAQQAAHSLLQAEQQRLFNLATLFAERPTLQHILQDQAYPALAPYLNAFQTQSKLDILFFCRPDTLPLAGNRVVAHCPVTDTVTLGLVQTQPALLISRTVRQNATSTPLGFVVAGTWLNTRYLQQMAASTGVDHSIIATNGTRLVSTIGVSAALTSLVPSALPANYSLTLADQPFYASLAPLALAHEPAQFRLETALPATELINAEQRALVLLISITSLIALLGVLFAAWYIGRLIKPLGQLTQVAERIGRGDFVAPIPAFANPSEIATLSTAFIKSQAAMLRDLEERAQARDWLNTLIQSIVEGVITFDHHGRVTFISQGAETLLGWRSDEAIGQLISTLLPPPNGASAQLWDRIPPPGGKRQMDVRTRQQKTISLSVTGARLLSPQAPKAQVALVLRDVTHEEAIRNLRAYFLANISHEFQTPLSTLSASLELLLDSAEEYSLDEVRELLKPAQLSLLGLQNLINNLLQSSSIEAGHFTIRLQPTDLAQVVTAARQLVQPLLDRRQQQLTLMLPDTLPELLADPARLTQVFANLLANASKYSPLGTAIELQVTHNPCTLRVAVVDRGAGIPPTERQNLFQRFVRLDTQNHEQYGIGLGLYVVKTTVELHGGQVGVDERPGGGSIFWFTLPLSEPDRTEGAHTEH